MSPLQVLHGLVDILIKQRHITFQKVQLDAKGITHRGPYKDGPGEINVPIQVGGVVIHPGDLILADMDGIVCVPFEFAESLVEKVHKTMEMEKYMLDAIEKGTIDRSWIDEFLRQKGSAGI